MYIQRHFVEIMSRQSFNERTVSHMQLFRRILNSCLTSPHLWYQVPLHSGYNTPVGHLRQNLFSLNEAQSDRASKS